VTNRKIRRKFDIGLTILIVVTTAVGVMAFCNLAWKVVHG
jgi:hypothetical protein